MTSATMTKRQESGKFADLLEGDSLKAKRLNTFLEWTSNEELPAV